MTTLIVRCDCNNNYSVSCEQAANAGLVGVSVILSDHDSGA